MTTAAHPTLIERGCELETLSALVGAEAAQRYLAAEPAPQRKRRGRYATFVRCLGCGKPRKTPTRAPRCGSCVGKLGASRRWGREVAVAPPPTPEQRAAEVKFCERWKADPAFRSIAGAAAAAQICALGGHPPLDMLERVARAAEAQS